MWPQTFDARLTSWNQLRDQCRYYSAESALNHINAWWFGTPWSAYYLHWDDQENWPDPWQLLSDNVYCEVARGLGILYTITLLDRADLTPVSMVLTESGANLVQVAKGKYILNWESDSVVNTIQELKIKKQYQEQHIT
jgi:hypothetical protein